VAKVEADRRPHEQLKRHFVDRITLGVGVEEGVHMRADVIQHADVLDRRCEWIARNALIVSKTALVRHPFEIHRTRHVLVRRHIVFDRDTEVDNVRHESSRQRAFNA
jgi:hypothetical protein